MSNQAHREPFAITNKRILIIKHGALGDIVLATGPFKGIREAHANDRVTLLTSTPYVDFLRPSGWFDEIMVDDRTPALRITTWLQMIRALRAKLFHRVYDLQHSNRTSLLFRALSWSRDIEWSGIATGCSHPHVNPHRDNMHTIERQAEQLAAAGIAKIPPTDLEWVTADTERFDLPGRYALVVPGGAPHRPAKRWPSACYSKLVAALAADGYTPVLIGGTAEAATLHDVAAAIPQTKNLCGRTNLADIVALARSAVVSVGNDTGPMHLAAAAGCPSVVLFSSDSDPALTAPQGPHVEALRTLSLANLGVDKVVATMRRVQATTEQPSSEL